MGVVKLLSFVLLLLGATYAAVAVEEPLDTNPMRGDGFAPKLPDMGPNPETR